MCIRDTLGGRHILARTRAHEDILRSCHRLVGLFLAVHQLGQLVGKDLLGLVELRALPLVHFLDLIERQEGQHADALKHIRVVHIAPVQIGRAHV